MADDLETEKFPAERALSARADDLSEAETLDRGERSPSGYRTSRVRDVDGGRLPVRSCCALPCWRRWPGMFRHSDIWQKQLSKNLRNRLRGC